MPLFCIHAFDRPGAASVRAENYPAHRAFLSTAADWGVTIHASGPLVTDDGAAMMGSLFVIEADGIETAKRFNAADPFAKAGLWSAVNVTRFDLKRGSVGTPASSAS